MARTVGRKPAAHTASGNRLRIIGGRFRGARVEFPPIAAVRPSPDRVRETLFNWLQPVIVGARCLDLFAGSGALGLEALSRGAAEVTFVDSEPRLGVHLRQTVQRLGAEGAAVFTADAQRFLQRTPQPFDVVFLDPPFASRALPAVCAALADGWLAKGAWIYIECSVETPLLELPSGWRMHRARRAGQVGYHLLQADA